MPWVSESSKFKKKPYLDHLPVVVIKIPDVTEG